MRRIIGAARRAAERVLRVDCVGCGREAPRVVCRACLVASGDPFSFQPLPDPIEAFSNGGFFLARYAMAGEPAPVARALLRFKYAGDRACGHFLKRVILGAAPTLRTDCFDVVVPIPLHRKRLRERGYNQAAWLARATAKGLRLPMRFRALSRVRNTPPQARASGHERRILADAFVACERTVAGKRVLLVDDVYTTGATAADAARAITSAGASGVGIVVLLAALRD